MEKKMMKKDEKARAEVERRSEDLLGRRIRLLTHENAEIGPDEMGNEYHDGVVLKIVRSHKFKGKNSSNSVVLVDFQQNLPTREEVAHPIRYVLLRSRFKGVAIEIVLDGKWVDVDPFVVNPEGLGLVRDGVDLDDRQNFQQLISQQCYLTPEGRDPYVETWIPHKLLESHPIKPQPYRNRKLGTCFELVVESPDGTILRGYTTEDDLARRKVGSVVNLKYSLVNCSTISHENPWTRPYLKKALLGGPYTYELLGTVKATWWPDAGMFKEGGGDFAGWFTIDAGDVFVKVEDSLDKREAIGGLRMGDCVRAVGRLQFSWRLKDRLHAED